MPAAATRITGRLPVSGGVKIPAGGCRVTMLPGASSCRRVDIRPGGGEMGASLLALVPALLGMWLGQVVRRRISALWFKRGFFTGMALLGGHLLLAG